jgi:hypothetical protein
MRLKDFEHAQVQEGYVYELGRGLIVVSDVPKPQYLEPVAKLTVFAFVWHSVSWDLRETTTGGLPHGPTDFT